MPTAFLSLINPASAQEELAPSTVSIPAPEMVPVIEPDFSYTYVEYQFPNAPYIIFMFLLLPLVITALHLFFTIKYWRVIGSFLRTANVGLFIPVIYFAFGSIQTAFIYNSEGLGLGMIAFVYIIWPFYLLLAIYWLPIIIRQKRKKREASFSPQGPA